VIRSTNSQNEMPEEALREPQMRFTDKLKRYFTDTLSTTIGGRVITAIKENPWRRLLA
jgi:hypothetical protein